MSTDIANGVIQRVNVLTTTGKPSSRRLILGDPALDHIDSSNNQQSAVLSIIQKNISGAGNPVFISMSTPDSRHPSGFKFGMVGGITGGNRPVIFSRSDFAYPGTKQETTDVGLEFISVMNEPDKTGNQTGFKFTVKKANDSDNFISADILSNPKTILMSVDAGPDNMAFNCRVGGDFHFGGTVYYPLTEDLTGLDNKHFIFKYEGPGNEMLILPNPNDKENYEKNKRIHCIMNYGDGDLLLNYPVFLDKQKTTKLVPKDFPNNVLYILCDKGKYYRI